MDLYRHAVTLRDWLVTGSVAQESTGRPMLLADALDHPRADLASGPVRRCGRSHHPSLRHGHRCRCRAASQGRGHTRSPGERLHQPAGADPRGVRRPPRITSGSSGPLRPGSTPSRCGGTFGERGAGRHLRRAGPGPGQAAAHPGCGWTWARASMWTPGRPKICHTDLVRPRRTGATMPTWAFFLFASDPRSVTWPPGG